MLFYEALEVVIGEDRVKDFLKVLQGDQVIIILPMVELPCQLHVRIVDRTIAVVGWDEGSNEVSELHAQKHQQGRRIATSFLWYKVVVLFFFELSREGSDSNVNGGENTPENVN